MSIFGAAHGWGGPKRPPLSKTSDTYPTIMKFGTVIPYLEKIQKRYESRQTSSDFTGNQQIWFYQEIQL